MTDNEYLCYLRGQRHMLRTLQHIITDPHKMSVSAMIRDVERDIIQCQSKIDYINDVIKNGT